jgi:hypothetical protein
MEYWLVGALVFQLAWPRLAVRLGVGAQEFLIVWVLVALLVLGTTVVNFSVPGMLLVTAGLILNLAVILPNGGMPVSMAAIPSGLSDAENALLASPLHVASTADTFLPLLGDVVYVPGPSWHRAMVSIGDIAMALGAGLVAFWATRCRAGMPD